LVAIPTQQSQDIRLEVFCYDSHGRLLSFNATVPAYLLEKLPPIKAKHIDPYQDSECKKEFQDRVQHLWVKSGQFNGGTRADFMRDGRTNKWYQAKRALAA